MLSMFIALTSRHLVMLFICVIIRWFEHWNHSGVFGRLYLTTWVMGEVEENVKGDMDWHLARLGWHRVKGELQDQCETHDKLDSSPVFWSGALLLSLFFCPLAVDPHILNMTLCCDQVLVAFFLLSAGGAGGSVFLVAYMLPTKYFGALIKDSFQKSHDNKACTPSSCAPIKTKATTSTARQYPIEHPYANTR